MYRPDHHHGPTARTLPPAVHYTLHSARLTAKNVGFVIFAVALPVILYLIFSHDLRRRRSRAPASTTRR